MKRLAVVLLLSVSMQLWGQGLASAPNDPRMSPEAAQREAAIAPALQAMNRHDYATALVILEAVMPDHPRDARVLMFAGRAAHLSGDNAKALSFYRTALSFEPPKHPQWGLHLEIVPLYAATGDWENFDIERTKIREAALQSEPYFAKMNSYLIEETQQGDKTVQVTEFLQLFGRFHTRYRFQFPLDASLHGWRPFIDCESDDMDQVSFQKSHPDLAASGGRSFSLDGYLQPNMHSTIMLFGDGEPTYETVRALVVKNAPPLATTVRP